MKKKVYSEDQIIKVLREVQNGAKVTEVCRIYGISDATYYNWKSKYQGLGISELRRLKQLEEENRRLKHLVAEQALDIAALKGVLSKKY